MDKIIIDCPFCRNQISVSSDSRDFLCPFCGEEFTSDKLKDKNRIDSDPLSLNQNRTLRIPNIFDLKYSSKESVLIDNNCENNTQVSTNKIVKIESFSSDGTSGGIKQFSYSFKKSETSFIGIKVYPETISEEKDVVLNWRIYKEDGSPFTDNIHCSIHLSPMSAWISQKWGWEDTGMWPAGKYRIIASIDHGESANLWFEITDDAPMSGLTEHKSDSSEIKNDVNIIYNNNIHTNPYRIIRIESFSSDGSANGNKLFDCSFFKDETSYIGIKIYLDKSPEETDITLNWRIYNEDGSPLTNDIIVSTHLQPNADLISHMWGWNQTGIWPEGKYKIVASINNGEPTSLWFEIKDGKFDDFDYPIENIKLFNGDFPLQDSKKRLYSDIFYQYSVKYIYFQFEFPKLNRDIVTDFNLKINDENGNCIISRISSASIKAGSQFFCDGWGYTSLKNWKSGKYSYSVSLGKQPPVTGTFIIKD